MFLWTKKLWRGERHGRSTEEIALSKELGRIWVY